MNPEDHHHDFERVRTPQTRRPNGNRAMLFLGLVMGMLCVIGVAKFLGIFDDEPARQEPAAAVAPKSDPDAVRRRDYLERHPNLNWVDHDEIWMGKIRIGFTQEEVVASLGQPTSTSRHVSRSGVWETWYYRGITVSFSGGQVESWTE